MELVQQPSDINKNLFVLPGWDYVLPNPNGVVSS